MSFLIILSIFGQLQVQSVSDGDSFKLKTSEGFSVKARLVGLDCPEMGVHGKKKKKPQAGAKEAKERLSALVLNAKDLKIEPVGTDPFGRSLVEVYLADGRLVNELLITEGYCEAYRGKIQKSEARYREAEKKAQAEKKGIWGMKNYESPYLFRKRQMR